ncbi:MAG: UDP-glucose/GDP-mannose dehydrogenase family protein [Acidobacteria bacterium]|nr:UDP-glucose/GDP-mannose dehydrogenase family protein [Acidobacteriota bacterium]
MNISIIGTGYVGLTTGVCLAYLGHDVCCVDTDAKKVETLKAGRSPIYEPHLEDLMALASDRLRFTTCYPEAIPDSEVVFIAVGTPPEPDGKPDLRYLRAAAQSAAENLGAGFTVMVNKSTVPIGSGNWVESLVRSAIRERNSDRFAVASNPEFLREGSAIRDSLYPDRIVIGSDSERALETLYTLYRPVLDQTFAAPTFLPRPEELGAVPLVSADLASAELIKYAANAFLALKISYINEISQIAEKVGADITQVAKGIGLDARIGTRFLQPGIGWGGSCFGKDTAALISTAHEYNLTAPIVQAARDINSRQRARVVEKLLAEMKILKGRTVALLGLAFKPHTDDLREAPALEIAKKLIERGARVQAHDPVALDRARAELALPDLCYCDSPEQAMQDADAVVLVTEWPQYLELDWESLRGSMRGAVVLDGRGVLDRKRMEKSGYRFLSMTS